MPDLPPPEDLPPGALLRIDAACDRFEAEWQAGQRPCIDDFLAAAVPGDRPALAAALAALAAEYLARATRPPNPGSTDSNATAALDAVRGPQSFETTIPHDPHAAPGRPAVIPGYELQEELGRGGMGVVHKARDTRLNRVVALKTILRADAPGRASVARFWAEAEVMAAVRHPHVVPVYELREHDGMPFLAMEYLAGGSLSERVRAAAPMPAADAAVLVGKIASGMAAAHELGIVHRDLKPGNVLLDAVGEPKVTDFGLAKRQAHDLTATQALMGTPAYMAPEQAAGRAKFVGPQADVWALGVILYECLTGRRPFAADTVESLLRQIMSDDPVPLRTFPGRVPRDLDTIVSRCLGKEPADRYPTAADLAADLSRYTRGEPIAARPFGRAERVAKWIRRHPTRAAAWALGGTATALLAVTLVVTALWRDAAGARDTADAARAGLSEANGKLEDSNSKLEGALSGERVAAATADAARKDAERARDGEAKAKRAIAYLNYAHAVDLALREYSANNIDRADRLLADCPPDLRGWEWHYVHRLCHTEALAVRGLKFAMFSPAGRRVAIDEADGRCHIRDTETGRDLSSVAGVPLTFSGDETRLATFTTDLLVHVWDVSTGRELASVPGYKAAFSHDGRRLATTSRDTVARVWDVDSGKQLCGIPGPKVLDDRGQPFPGGFLTIKLTADGTRVLALATDQRVWVCDAVTGNRTAMLAPPVRQPDGKIADGKVIQSWFSTDGNRALLHSIDGTLRVWDAGAAKELTLDAKESGFVVTGNFSADGKRVVTSSMDHKSRVWDVETGKQLAVLQGHTQMIGWSSFSADGTRVVSTAIDNSVRVWDAAGGKELATFPLQTPTVAGFSPDGTRVHAVSQSGEARVWAVAPPADIDILPGLRKAVLDATFSPDGTKVAMVLEDLTVRVCETATGRPLASLPGPCGHTTAFSGDGKRLATIALDNTAVVWEIETGKAVATLRGHTRLVNSMAFTSDGSRVVTAAYDNTARVWEAATGKEVVVIPGTPTARINSAAVSGDGKRIVTLTADNTTRSWDAVTGHKYAPRVATPDLDTVARVWDAGTGQQVAVLKGHRHHVTSVLFAAGGNRIVTTSSDNSARVWDAATGAELAVLQEPSFPPLWAAVSGDGNRILTGVGSDAGVRVWDAGTGRLMLTLRGAGGGVSPRPGVPVRTGAPLRAAFGPGGHVIWTALSGFPFRVTTYDARPLAGPPREKTPGGRNP